NAKLFPDQKTFADAIPNSDPLMILADYRMQRNQSGFDLRHFVTGKADAVFMGGSCGHLTALIDWAMGHLHPGGRLVMTFILQEN
ncbi:hypothetical protein MJM99_32795, partial [Salmonella enterica subsp. enterica serovar Kentucky]|nr:hypothetical protein [Salmonella enterica subsp. enterica serovar Kentucky]